MNSEVIKIDQVLAVHTAPFLQVESSELESKPIREEHKALNQSNSSDQVSEEDLPESEMREPLRERRKNEKENQENIEQEQIQEEDEESSSNGDKINEYVARVLEKIVKQRTKMAQLSSILEKKGLISEKDVSQIQNIIQENEEAIPEKSGQNIEDNENSNENHSKENLSPLRGKFATKLESLIPSSGSKGISPTGQKSIARYSIEDVLQISRQDIDFGTHFPGQVIEEHLDIVNKSSHDFVVQIIVTCLNDDLQNTEEYVYSVRRSHLYDYNDKHYLIMAPFSCAGFKFALKVPNLLLKENIIGQVKISIQGMNGEYVLDLTTKVAVPKIYCPKELHFKGLGYSVIKLAVKEGKKQDVKLPIRNNGEVPVTLELEFYDPKESKESDERPIFDCLVHPNVINIAPNSNTLTTVMIKPWKTTTSLKNLEKPKANRKILTGRVRDSALIYSFVFWIEIY